MSVVMDRVMPRHKITVDEYYRMAEEGLLAPDARVELIEGEIIPMPPIGTVHAARTTYITRQLFRALGEHVGIRTQNPMRLSEHTETEPDVVLTVAMEDEFLHRHPTPPDTLLVIEVSHSTLRYDKETKLPLYAKSGVPEVWIVNIPGQCIDVYRRPHGNRYELESRILSAQPLTMERLPGVEIDLSKVFEAC
jgi:Uma2 family endonuclease